MNKFQEAIKRVMRDMDKKKYPRGMMPAQVLAELRKRNSEFSLNLALTTTLDVRDELETLYR